MARVTKKSTRNTRKRKKFDKRQSRPKPSVKVAVREETAGESETEESVAQVQKENGHSKKYKVSTALLHLSSLFVSSL